MLVAFLSLIAGFLSVLAPCVLPLLPIIIGGSFADDKSKKRPYIIVGSLVFSLILFTLLLKVSTSLIGIDPKVWNYFSGSIVILLGLSMLFPQAWDYIIGNLGLQAKSQKLLGGAGKQQNGTLSAVLTGLALGPVFSSCSPMYAWVIATVLPENTARGLLYLGMYSIGLAIALLGIALLGRRLIDRIKWASNPHGLFQKIIAILFIAVGLAVITGYDKKIQTFLVDKDFLNIKSLEIKLVPEENDNESQENTNKIGNGDNELLNVVPYTAPELLGLQDWINSEPLTLESLKGKVVLIDFWTYSCINCERTLPYVQAWYDNYKDDGFVVLGIHAPEFGFEKVLKNVDKAVSDRKLTYPVALDNDFKTWRAYKNQFWPAHYLVDKNGQVRRTHFGEGQYEETEEAIRLLLAESGSDSLREKTVAKEPIVTSNIQTPEIYIGGQRAQNFTNENYNLGTAGYLLAVSQPLNTWSLGGRWTVDKEFAKCIESCTLQLSYISKNVYGVFSGSVDGEISIGNNNIPILSEDIYTIVEKAKSSQETIVIEFTPGLAIHAFTFGG